jgi:hypothetical protein
LIKHSRNEINLRGQDLKIHCDDRDYENHISFNRTQICIETNVNWEKRDEFANEEEMKKNEIESQLINLKHLSCSQNSYTQHDK